MPGTDLDRFIQAQDPVHATVVAEVRAGEKRTHWMWFEFPQLAGLGKTATAQHFGIHGVQEAARYLAHPVLGSRLVELTQLVLENGATPEDMFGPLDALKFRSCMTLFALVPAAPSVFAQALGLYPPPCALTLEKLKTPSAR